jgi:hypothetical protein
MKSDRNQPHDLIESWLHHNLGAYRPKAPSDAWQRLAPHLPQRRRRRPVGYWLTFSAAIMAVVFALLGLLKLAALPDTMPVAVKNDSPITLILPIGSEKIESPATVEKQVATTVEPIIKNNFSKKINPKPATGSFNNLAESVSAEVRLLKMGTGQAIDLSEKISSSQNKDLFEKIPSQNLVSLISEKNHHSEIEFADVTILPEKAKKNSFWLCFEAAYSLLVPKNTVEPTDGLVFPEMQLRPGKGLQKGFSVALEPLKNWRISIGIHYMSQMHVGEHAARLRLMDGICLTPHVPGLKEYQFQYSVVSGGEQNKLTLRLQQQDVGSTMPDDEPFTLEMKTVHRSTAWRVPLGMERRFGEGKWQCFVRGGAVVDFSEKSKTEVTHFTEVCQDLCFQTGHVPSIQTDQHGAISVGWLAGAGIERRLSKRAALRFEPFIIGQKGSIQYGLGLGLIISN